MPSRQPLFHLSVSWLSWSPSATDAPSLPSAWVFEGGAQLRHFGDEIEILRLNPG